MSDHGEWDKDQERYEDGCRSDAPPHDQPAHQPHRINIETEWDDFTRMKALVDQSDADDFLAVLYAWRDEAVTDASNNTREQLAAELVPLLVEHSPCYDHRGYAAMCDCNHGPYNRDADGNRLKDTAPLTLYAEHIASLIRR